MRKHLNIEIKTAEGSRFIDNITKRRIKEYSLSSQNRRKFLMYCIRAQLENDYLLVTDLIKMIDSDKLKTKLFKLYNEDLKRHEVHTKEFDKFFLDYNYRLSENFYLQDTWSTSPIDEKPIIISGYRFNEKYYRSSKIFADIIESKSSIQQYIRELNDLFNSFTELKSLCLDELQ